jgi:hypothetical protein
MLWGPNMAGELTARLMDVSGLTLGGRGRFLELMTLRSMGGAWGDRYASLLLTDVLHMPVDRVVG